MANLLAQDTDTRGRRITMGVFAALVAFFFLASSLVPVPGREQVDRSLDLIMLEAIAMEESAMAEEETEEPVVEDDLSQQEVSVEDFDVLLSAFTEQLSPETLDEESTLPDRGQTETLVIQSDVGLDFGSEGALDLFGDSRPGDRNADLLPQSRGETWTLKPNLISGSVSRSNGRLSSGTGEKSAELAVRPGRPERLVESLFGAQDDVSLTSEEINRENAVVRWMQERLNALDRPIRTVFEQQSNDLTVNEPVIIGEKNYHLQMMYSPVSRTLHVAWIDGEDIYYFVDPALQFRVNYFGEGLVERASSIAIVLLEIEELPAQSPQAIREYGIFLNWWRPQIEENQDE
ncbi:MAG: hypothetical protein F4107_02725 [Gemmatimonadetes bacterium]|nr:hypothetical protein [Rhodothermaceae bacterium]MXX58771.1 hypothetical protein [Rhodothermaceae bacterium]MYD19359.1 hypothetical protein [Rhodothermaceae bacterium]MYI64839.1 hypothetical protein [Gemmatimonadota bacterium]MYJ55172.1 hypothetical protein [Rhodothermaceae bacterium]